MDSKPKSRIPPSKVEKAKPPATVTPAKETVPAIVASAAKAAAPAEPLLCSCGHPAASKGDVKAAARGDACGKCRLAAEQVKQAEQRAKRAQPKPKQPAWVRIVPRLPDGAEFQVRWHEQEKLWKGSLLVPARTPDAEGIEFHGEENAVFRLLIQLDRRFREWEQEQGRKQTDGNGSEKEQP